jgi:hypothetical protein
MSCGTLVSGEDPEYFKMSVQGKLGRLTSPVKLAIVRRQTTP